MRTIMAQGGILRMAAWGTAAVDALGCVSTQGFVDGGAALEGGQVDASHEGAVSASEDAGAWCKVDAGGAGHIFCADFDEGDALLGWDPLEGSTRPALDTALFRSAPASVAFEVGTESDAASGTVLIKHFPQNVATATLAYDVYPDALPAAGAPGFGGLRFPAESVRLGLGPVAGRNGASLSEEIPGDGGFRSVVHPLPKPVPAGTWTRVTITVHLGGDGGASFADVSLNGEPALEREPLDFNGARGVAVWLGIEEIETTTPAKAHFDNVTLDLEGT